MSILLAGWLAGVARPAGAADRVPLDPTAAQALEQSGIVELDVTGRAPATLQSARAEALEDAFRAAVEQGGGLAVQSLSSVADGMLVRDEILSECHGFVVDWSTLAERDNQDGFHVIRIRARVRQGGIQQSIDGLRTLIRRKGHPRMILVSDAGRREMGQDWTAQVEEQLRRRGFDVVSHRVEEGAKAAEATGEQEEEKRNRIIASSRADYLIVCTDHVESYPKQTVDDITWTPMRVTCSVEVVRADTGLVLATAQETAESKRVGDTRNITDEVLSELSTKAVDKVIGYVATDWLQPLRDLEVSLYRADADLVNDVVSQLKGVRGMEDVTVRRTDDDGFTEVTMMSRYNAGDVVLLLKRAMPELPPAVRSTDARISIDCSRSWSLALARLGRHAISSIAAVSVVVVLAVAAAGRQLHKAYRDATENL